MFNRVRPAPTFVTGRDGKITIGSTYDRPYGAGTVQRTLADPISNAVEGAVNDVGESISDWFSNNGVNVFAVLLGILIFIAFIISVAK